MYIVAKPLAGHDSRVNTIADEQDEEQEPGRCKRKHALST
jgi:hypothetical protein